MSRPSRFIFSNLDHKLINEVAELWVSTGGDSTGFEMVQSNIANRIDELNAEKEAEVEP